jgi:hypothetical protein
MGLNSEQVMDADQVKALLGQYDIFDQTIVEHGFTQYMRDYRVVAEIYGRRSADAQVEVLKRYAMLFRGCVEAIYVMKVQVDLNDVYLDYKLWRAAGSPDGFVWAVNSAEAYPGLTYIDDSERAVLWTAKASMPMHELSVETNVYELRVVFAELSVTAEPPG